MKDLASQVDQLDLRKKEAELEMLQQRQEFTQKNAEVEEINRKNAEERQEFARKIEELERKNAELERKNAEERQKFARKIAELEEITRKNAEERQESARKIAELEEIARNNAEERQESAGMRAKLESEIAQNRAEAEQEIAQKLAGATDNGAKSSVALQQEQMRNVTVQTNKTITGEEETTPHDQDKRQLVPDALQDPKPKPGPKINGFQLACEAWAPMNYRGDDRSSTSRSVFRTTLASVKLMENFYEGLERFVQVTGQRELESKQSL